MFLRCIACEYRIFILLYYTCAQSTNRLLSDHSKFINFIHFKRIMCAAFFRLSRGFCFIFCLRPFLLGCIQSRIFISIWRWILEVARFSLCYSRNISMQQNAYFCLVSFSPLKISEKNICAAFVITFYIFNIIVIWIHSSVLAFFPLPLRVQVK